MPLVFVGRIKEERDYFEERANYWRSKSEYWLKKCLELSELALEKHNELCKYRELGSICYIRKLVEDDKRKAAENTGI